VRVGLLTGFALIAVALTLPASRVYPLDQRQPCNHRSVILIDSQRLRMFRPRIACPRA